MHKATKGGKFKIKFKYLENLQLCNIYTKTLVLVWAEILNAFGTEVQEEDNSLKEILSNFIPVLE